MASWTGLNNQPSFNADTMLLLTDGTVMVHEYGSKNWHRLTPDSSGNYVKGSWSSLASLPDDSTIPSSKGGPTNAPLYFASAVLRDGRVFTSGGEYNSGVANADISSTQIYDPLADAWTAIKPPPDLPQVGDAISCMLADGRIIIGTSSSGSTAVDILDPNTLIYQQTGAKGDSPSEESWTLMPNGAVLTVQCSNSPNAEMYDPASNTWVAAGATPSSLDQPCPGSVAEIGPALLLPDGRVFAIGASGATALYTPNAGPTVAGTWAVGPNLQDSGGNTLFPMDAPAVLLPSGKVLLTASPGPPCNYPSPMDFFLFDPTVTPTPSTLTALSGQASNNGNAVYQSRLLLLPNGQVLHANNSNDIEVYTPDGGPQDSWRPVITGFPQVLVLGRTHTLSGTQFNGLSQACSYGDDAQMATNYPIARLSNAAGQQLYLRTANHSSMGVATGTALVTTEVTVVSQQGQIATGPWQLAIIANGIASHPVNVTVAAQDALFEIERSTFGAGEIQAIIDSGGAPAVIDPALYVLVEGFSQDAIGSNLPTIPDPVTGLSYRSTGGAVPSDPSLPSDATQSFTYQFAARFTDTSMFGSSDQPLMLSASFSDTFGDSVQASGVIELLATPDPYILHGGASGGEQWYLSLDLGVFQVESGGGAFNTPMPSSGDVHVNAETFIGQVLDNLNAPGNPLASQFEATVQPSADSVLNLAPTAGGNTVYNFALARVRYQDVQSASDVRVFFRLWQAQQTNAAFNTGTDYREHASGISRIPLFGIQGDEITTIPFFAKRRIATTSASMTTQADDPNVRTLQPGSGGALTYAYFGCWLDVNQPNDKIFPPWMAGVAPVDGPYTGGNLVSIQQLVRATHQCLIAEIAYDPDPIPAGADPSTTDKLAQRNLTFINIPNPGIESSRVTPQPFEIKPSRKLLLRDKRPDELMITWDNIPRGATAQIYLPGAASADVLDWAGRIYAEHPLTAADAHTIEAPARGVTYMPIPQATDGFNLKGLLSVAFPGGVRRGELYQATVRQLSSQQRFTQNVNDSRVTEAEAARNFFWRRVTGIFHLTIPVSTKAELLDPESRAYSILLWIGKTVPKASRWKPVWDRYLEQLGLRITGLGGDPGKIKPSPTGAGAGKEGRGEGHGEDRLHEVRGKVLDLVYNHFGDFEGFTLETEYGRRHRFDSREIKVEYIAKDALVQRWWLTVASNEDEPHRPLWILLSGSPAAPDR